MSRSLSDLAAITIAIFSGIGHGLGTGRRLTSDGFRDRISRFDRVGMTVGDRRAGR